MALEDTKREKKRRPDCARMTAQTWPAFDEKLRIKLQQINEPDVTAQPREQKVAGPEETTSQDLTDRYKNLAQCVYETIKEEVPEKEWIRKNGRVVTSATKELFERRAQEYQKEGKLDEERRKKWNKTIRNACRNDYRHWVATWAQKIEDADNKDNTKEIYRGVKALSGASQHSTTRPTMHWKRTDLKKSQRKLR